MPGQGSLDCAQGHRKAPVGLRIAGEQQQAGGVAIEAMGQPQIPMLEEEEALLRWAG